MFTPHATEACSQKPRTPSPRSCPAPSLLGAVVDSIPQTHHGAVSLQTTWEKCLTYRQLDALAFHGRLAAVGVGTLAVALRRSARASAPSMQLRPLPDHVARAVRAPWAAPAPPFCMASARSPSTGVAGQRPREGDGTEKQASSAVVPTDRGITTAVSWGS